MKANRIADWNTTNCRSSKYPLRISFTSHIAELDSSIVTVSLNHKLILEYSRMKESLQNIRMVKKMMYREVWLLSFSVQNCLLHFKLDGSLARVINQNAIFQLKSFHVLKIVLEFWTY